MSTLAAAILEDQKVPNIVTYNAGPMGGCSRCTGHGPLRLGGPTKSMLYILCTCTTSAFYFLREETKRQDRYFDRGLEVGAERPQIPDLTVGRCGAARSHAGTQPSIASSAGRSQ